MQDKKNKKSNFSNEKFSCFPKPLKVCKKGEFNFAWLFAVIVGTVILILAVYGATKISEMKKYETDTEIGKTIDILTDPLQATWAEGRYGKIEFKQETKINNLCSDAGFGKNEISVSTKSRISSGWQEAGGGASIHDKYIFSSPKQGKKYYVFSKAFELPYKVSDLIFLSADKYCFLNPSGKIERDLSSLGVENIEIKNRTDDCSPGFILVCFESENPECDIFVLGDEKSGLVLKNKEKLEYVGNLVYGAIFSEKELYDCNVKRLLYRTGKIADVFIDVGREREARGIGTNLVPYLDLFSGLTMNSSSEDLISLRNFAEEMDMINNKEGVGLW